MSTFGFLWFLCLASATAVDVRIVYEEPREIAALIASRDGDKASFGTFGKYEGKDGEGRFKGQDVIVMMIPREGRKVAVFVSKEVEGTRGKIGFVRLARAERVTRIDCFEDDAGLDVYVYGESGIRKFAFRGKEVNFVESVVEADVPKMEEPVVVTFRKGVTFPQVK